LALILSFDRVSATAQQQFGGIMKSLFLEGLQSAREIVQNKGIAHLDSIIEELEQGTMETTAITPAMESR
jgi:phosphopantothenate synthetase